MKYHQNSYTKRIVINRGRRSKTPKEVKAVKNINKNPQSFLKESPV